MSASPGNNLITITEVIVILTRIILSRLETFIYSDFFIRLWNPHIGYKCRPLRIFLPFLLYHPSKKLTTQISVNEFNSGK